MSSRLFVAVVIASSLVVVAPVTARAVAEDRAQPATWAKKFCSGGTDWIDDLRVGRDAIADDLGTPPDPANVSEALVAFFTGAAHTTAVYATRLRSAGVPDVPHGEQIAEALPKALTRVRRAFAHAKADAAQLAVSDGAELQAGVDAAQTTLEQGLADVAASVGNVLRRAGSRELGEAFRGQDACQRFLPPPA